MKIKLTKSFEKEYKKITRGNVPLKRKVAKQLSLVVTNPNHPSLRLHKLVGVEYWSISVDMSIRILILFEQDVVVVYHSGTHTRSISNKKPADSFLSNGFVTSVL